ncbi:MAG: hypothetical protein HOO96_21725 [Polyangiaceae bacterium]|nr:hypothetical protein [Polyangiaceae bacterium]
MAEPRNRIEIVLATIVWVLLALAVLNCVWLTRAGLDFAHQQTCGPEPPTEWRRSVTLNGMWVTIAFGIPTLVLLVRGRIVGLSIALFCALVALTAPFASTVITLFASAMC